MLTKNGRDLPVEEITKENYEVPENEKGHFHAIIEVKRFDAATGDRQSVPRLQKFGVKTFSVSKKSLKKQGFTVTVLHDPTEHLKEMQAQKSQSSADLVRRKEEEKQRIADEKAAAEQKKIDDAVANALAAQQETFNKQRQKDKEALDKQIADSIAAALKSQPQVAAPRVSDVKPEAKNTDLKSESKPKESEQKK